MCASGIWVRLVHIYCHLTLKLHSWYWYGCSGRSITTMGLGQIRQGLFLMLLQSAMFWHQLQWTKSQTAILFVLVLSDCYFASICITRVFWEQKIWSIKPGVAVGLISLMSSYSEIVISYYRVILAYFWGVVRHTYMRFISLIIHASSLKMNTELVLFWEVELRNSSNIHLSGKKNSELWWSVLEVM